jgi:autotransporter-associated beta strand protein
VRHRITPFLVLVLAILASMPLRADILFWDGDTTAGNLQDGGGTWNTSANDRWFNPLTPGYQQWNNTTPDSAVFGQGGAGPYTVTLGEAIAVEDITFQSSGYTIAGGGNSLTLAAGSTITATGNATLNVGLAGTNGFTKEGAGNLTLGGGAANTLTGTITVNAGTLTWGGSNQIADTANIVVSGGTLNFNNQSDTFASYTQTSGTGVPNGANTGIVTITGTLAISGGSGMTINSNGQWSANMVDFTGWTVAGDALLMGGNGTRLTSLTVGPGGMVLSGQQITLNSTNTVGGVGNAIILNGDLTASGTNLLRASASSGEAGSVTQIDLGAVNRTFNITGGTTTIQNGLSIVGTGGLTKSGAGTLTFDTVTNGNLINPGTITISEGTILWAKSNQVADTVNIVVNGGAANFGGVTETIANFTQTSSTTAGSLTGTNGTLTVTGTLLISSGTGVGTGFTVNSGAQVTAGTVDLRGSNYTGAGNQSILMGGNTAPQITQLTVGAGGLFMDGQTIQMNAGPVGNRIVLNGTVTASGTNVFRMDASAQVGAVHEIDLGGVARTFDITGGTTTIGSAITLVNGGVTKTGAGTLTYSGTAANTYTGLTTVTAGTLTMSKTSGVNAIAGNVLINGGTLTWGSVNEQMANTSSLEISSGILNFNNRVETLLNLTKTGGEMRNHGSTITILGTLAVSGGTSNNGQGWAWTINSGGHTSANTVDFRGFVNGSNGNAVLQIGGNSTSVISTLTVGSGGLLLDGQTLTLNPGTGANALGSQIVLNGDVTASGTNIFAANSGTAVPNSVTRIDMGSGTRTWNITGGTTTVNSAIGVIGSANLVKTGAGTLQFNGAASYTGKTTVSQGTLTLTFAGSIDSSPWIQVDSGATLNVSGLAGGYTYAPSGTGVISGSGTIQGSLNIGAGKVLKPGTTSDPGNIATAGDGIGTLTVTGNLTFNPSSLSTVAEFKILSPSSADQINIGGSLALDANSNIVVTFDNANPFTQAAGQSWTLMDWVGSLNAAGFNPGANNRTGNNADGNEGNLDLPELSSGLFWQVENFSGSGSLTISIVPEPGRALLFVCGLATILFRRRRC